MTEPPPANLNDWGKKALVAEVERLRAITREMAAPVVEGDPRERATLPVVDVAQDPHAQGGALFDARGATLLDYMEVLLVDSKSASDPIHMYLALKGRINYSHDHVEHGYLFGADGAAAFCSEITGLANRAYKSGTSDGRRFAEDFKRELNRRLAELP